MKIEIDTLGIIDVEAIGYSINKEGHTVLHKYGPKKMIEKWAKDTREIYLKKGYLNFKKEIKLLEIGNIDIHEVNKMINICGYIGTFLKK